MEKVFSFLRQNTPKLEEKITGKKFYGWCIVKGFTKGGLVAGSTKALEMAVG